MQIPFAVSSSPGIRPQEGSGRLWNGYAVKAEQGSRFPVIWRRSAGLRQVHNIASHNHLRGGILVASTLIVVMDTRAYAVTESSGTFSSANLGALAGTDMVTVAKNNAGTPNIVCVSPAQGCFNLFTGSGPSSFADGDLPQPNSVSELNGYFIWTIGDGRIFASQLNSVDVASNSFTTEQSVNGLLRGVTFKGEFFAFGRTGCGVYKDVGTSPFPLQRQFAIGKGIIGTNAIAGWEEGWIDELLWVADDGIVYKLNGYTPEAVSNDDVTRSIAASVLAGRGGSLEASVYMDGKHAFWRLTDPGYWSWEYNATTANWCERESYGRTDCRASSAVRAFNRWIVGDRVNGKLYMVDPTYYREGTEPLIWRIRSGVAAAFPSRLNVPRADFDFAAAVGMAAGEDPVQTDPTVLIKWSRDGGHSFGNPLPRGLGAEGQADKRVTVNRLGSTGPKGIVLELAVSDPVHVGFLGGQIAVEQRAE